MSGSTVSATSLPPVQGHHHHHHRPAAAAATAGSSGATPAVAAAPAAGLQSFTDALKSILLNAQSGQASGGATPATVGPVRQIADQLQTLLGGSGVAPTSATASQPASLASVLDTLQQTLQQSLASYQQSDSTQSATLLTA